MDYEKAYKGAIERAKAEQETFIKGGNISGKSAIERIFPKLYMSEDERIKNEIIAFVEQSIHRGGGTPIPQEQENKWIAWLEKQGEQHSWSEEDEEMLNAIIADIQFTQKAHNHEVNQVVYEREIDWLKSLKDRVQPQLKQEWNEKDDKILNAVIKDIQERHPEAIWKINSGNTVAVSTEYIIDWLKSFKPNYWKPSEQNIKDLEWCADLVKDKMGVGFHRLQVFIDELKSL